MEFKHYLASVHISDEFTSIEQLKKTIETEFEEVIEYNKVIYPRDKFQFQWVFTSGTDEFDNGYLELQVFRSESKEEKRARIDAIKKKLAEETKKKQDAELRKVRLDLVQDDPDFIQYRKLQEKFKDIG